jgi:hypothetical protein
MDEPPFLISTLVNKEAFAETLVDSGCLSYGVIDSRFARKHNLQRIKITPRDLVGVGEQVVGRIDEVVTVRADIDGCVDDRAFFYVAPKLVSYDLILGLAWMRRNQVLLSADRLSLTIGSQRIYIQNQNGRAPFRANAIHVSAAAFIRNSKRKHKGQRVEVFSASMADIEKALAVRKETDPRTKLPEHFSEFLGAFDRLEAEKLPPLRGPGTDHAIELEKVDGKEPTVPWGPLYNMSRDELVVLRKTLTGLLDKQFIRVSNSPAAAPVLFVRKPSGGLRFCVDYRALNRISRKDRYPLPLIHETLRTIGKAKWFTKLDVIAAFHKIRIAEGDEWKTAFRTRYGLYEWLVTPFGLANAPSTFQKYINWTLRDYLDEFCSAYVDDVLVYSGGTLAEHREHVRKVLRRLQEAGLQLDIDKCEFEVQSTKYLGFVIEAGVGVRMDPEKVKAILSWEAPRSVKGVQSFIGFANFYRKFIQGFSDVVRPMMSLVKKDAAFRWTAEADQAFKQLKGLFTKEPVLASFDADRTTIVETDSSGWCIGGTLMQYGDDGVLRPCGYFSKKNSPAECNYEIYDKEMLAIVRCLDEWDAELRSVKDFQIRTDHKSLEYFMTVRKLTERQMRWSLALSRYNFTIQYVPGRTNERADALSRREQDLPVSLSDERLKHRHVQLLRPEMFAPPKAVQRVQALPMAVAEQGDLQSLWRVAEESDAAYEVMTKAVREGKRVFPPELQVKVSISECELNDQEQLLFRGRRWVPESEPLRTGLIQETHDSMVAGHPGREVTAALMMRQFFWPGMLGDIRRFVRNCDSCRKKQAWRDRRHGFLKPLPIPERIWSEISMDFIVELPLSQGCTSLLVITDRLSKGVILEPCSSLDAEAVAETFIRTFYRQHGLPRAIVSDRGTQFTGALWARVCQLLKIVRRLSTAFSPETDGSTERMNQNVEAFVRTYVDYAQENWAALMPLAELAVNNHDAASTGVSPFFLTHGYHVHPVELDDVGVPVRERVSPIQRGETIVRKLRDACEWAQASMAVAQQVQEDVTNRSRQQAPSFKVGDKVWLSLENVRTKRPSKKFDSKTAKYEVIEVISSHSYRLNTPPGIHNVFHSRLLRPVATDPLPSQRMTDSQPEPELVDGAEEYGVERILGKRVVRRGRGYQRQVLVKWAGYADPTWEPESAFQDVAALEAYENLSGEGGEEGGNVTG